MTGLTTPTQIKNELDVDYSTLKRWERAGLRRYSPPIEDILIFLGADK